MFVNELDVILEEQSEEQDDERPEADGHGDGLRAHLGRHAVGHGDRGGLEDERRKFFREEDVANTGDEGRENAFFLDLFAEMEGGLGCNGATLEP